MQSAAPSIANPAADSDVNSVIVRNVAPTVEPPTHKVLADFFSFCGNITALSIAPDDQDQSGQSVMAVVTFESKAAARTAVLLNNALINDKAIQVTLAPPGFTLVTNASQPQNAVRSVPLSDLPQRHAVSAEDRTQTSVVVSLLAKGYSLSNTALASARTFDEEHSISKKAAELRDAAAQGIRDVDAALGVSATLQTIGNTINQKAAEVDKNLQVSEKAQAAGAVLNDLGRSISQRVQGAASSTSEYVNASPTFASAANTVAGWGQSVAGVFREAQTLGEQEVAAKQGQAGVQGQEQIQILPPVAPAPVAQPLLQ